MKIFTEIHTIDDINGAHILENFEGMQREMYGYFKQLGKYSYTHIILALYKGDNESITGSKLAEVVSFIHFHELISLVGKPSLLEYESNRNYANIFRWGTPRNVAVYTIKLLNDQYKLDNELCNEAWKGHDIKNLLARLEQILVNYCLSAQI